jgi:hypothetical protein
VNEDGGTAQDRPILDRPILDEDGFQRLLAAAYILQPRNQHPTALPMAAPKRPFAAGKIIQRRTPSLLVRNPPAPAPWTLSWTPSWTMSAPIFWKASEALVIAAIFAVAAVSILSPLSARTTHSAEATEQRVAYERATAEAKVWGPARQSLVKPGSSQSSGGKNRLTAADIIAGYEKENDDTDLRSPAVEKPAIDLARSLPTASRLSQNRNSDDAPLKSGARLAFGRDADMLAAATVTRYGPDAWTYRWQDQKKAPQTSLRTNRSAN